VTLPADEDRAASPAAASDPLTRALLQLRLIAEAKARGASWAQVAATLGAPDGKAAKKLARQLARAAQRGVLARDREGGHA
jgi:hypothetical protein